MDWTDFIGLAGIPIIVGLIQVVKPWISDSRLLPPIALALGIAINVGIAFATGGNVGLSVLIGVVVGLASSGLYSQGRALTS
jgi:hypothetical protein